MVGLNPALWMIRRTDGSQIPFDVEKLKSGISDAFFLSGFPQESWLADEMAAGVEFSLSQLTEQQQRQLSESAIRELVAGLFAQTGFQAAAKVYLQLETEPETAVPGSVEHIFGLLQDHYPQWRCEQIKSLSERVASLIVQTGIVCPTSELILALALNLFRQAPVETIPLPIPTLSCESRMLISEVELMAELPQELKERLDFYGISIGPLSRVFPVLTVRVDLLRLVQNSGMNSPMTELSLMPSLSSAAVSAAASNKAIMVLLRRSEPLPMTLVLLQGELFATRCLSAGWPDPGERICLSIGGDLAARMNPLPYKILLG